MGVLPICSFDDKPLDANDVSFKTQRGSGPGGQHRNKVETSVRAVHIPTNIDVFINSGRSQKDNKDLAWSILSAKVNEL